MAIDEALERAGERRAKWIGIYIALVAVLLSITTIGASNAAKDAAKANLDAANTWAFFQAKNNRRQQYRFAAEELRLKLAERPDMTDELRGLITTKLANYDKQIARLTSDKESGEGLDELFHRAKSIEAMRDAALVREPYFDFAEGFLQIAIVLASVAIVTGGTLALVISFGLAAAGTFFAANGFWLFAPFM